MAAKVPLALNAHEGLRRVRFAVFRYLCSEHTAKISRSNLIFCPKNGVHLCLPA